jgi:hypothetical protein
MAAKKGFLDVVELILQSMKDVKLPVDLELLIECLRAGDKLQQASENNTLEEFKEYIEELHKSERIDIETKQNLV